MSFFRRLSLVFGSACLCLVGVHSLAAQDAQQQQPPPASPAGQQQPPAQPPKPQPAKPSPFETPQEAKPEPQTPAQPPKPQFEGAKPAPLTPEQANGQAIESIEIRGARRVPQDTLKAMITTKQGDIYNEEILRRDYMQLWNTKRFDDVTLETEPGREGV